MTDFEKTYQNYNPRQTALDEARALLTAAARAAMADGTLPEAELPAFIVEIPADVKNGDIASNIAGRSFCALGDAAATPVLSGIKRFRSEFEAGCTTPARELFPYEDSSILKEGAR